MEKAKKYLAELIGTFTLVTFGCGTACAVGVNSSLGSGYLITALAFGLTIVAMAYPIGHISGCHVNPAVSLAMWIMGKLNRKDLIGYIIAQLTGAAIGCVVIGALFGYDCGFGANVIQPGWAQGNVWTALLAECVLTFVFVMTVVGVAARKENGVVAGVVVGFSLTLVHILGIALTGTSVNPARSLLPAIFAMGEPIRQVWIFIVAPFVGAALAALIYRWLDAKKEK